MIGAGTVAGLWRYPVKSMAGEELTRTAVGATGVLGDRAFAVVDATDGTVATAKVRRPWAELLAFRARYSAEPEPGRPLPPVIVELPDGSVLRSDDETVHAALSELLGREVVLRADAGPYVDLAPAHLLTSATLARITELVGESDGAAADHRRFRPNVLLDLADPAAGFAEDAWIGRAVTLGAEVGLRPWLPTPRCVMTTLAQRELPASPVLSTLTRHHRLDVPGYGTLPCAGVYAEVTAAGTVTVGDPGTVADPASPV